MTTHDSFLPNAINLPSGVVAKIEISPMPKPDEKGRYPIGHQADIHVSLFRQSALIERRPWDTLICGDDAVTLADGTKLEEADLEMLDSSGWEQMGDFGMVPHVWVDKTRTPIQR